jgi:uncharacterized membrane protein
MAPEYSGSPESLVEWVDLGFQGRTFTGAATTLDDIAAYHGSSDGVEIPIRVYAGLKSAENTQERALLIVDELDRTNAQDREVLMLVATTGTGWVDPLAAAALEYMYRGDTAIAAMQYSFLPSWISFILDTETLWKPQEWTDKAVGPDVPDSVRWVPFTTFTQVVVDLINGLSASVGHGHNYNDTFAEGWAVVAPLDGWTAHDTEALQAYLDSMVDLPGL